MSIEEVDTARWYRMTRVEQHAERARVISWLESVAHVLGQINPGAELTTFHTTERMRAQNDRLALVISREAAYSRPSRGN